MQLTNVSVNRNPLNLELSVDDALYLAGELLRTAANARKNTRMASFTMSTVNQDDERYFPSHLHVTVAVSQE